MSAVETVQQQLSEKGYAAVRAQDLSWPEALESERRAFVESWRDLVLDTHMADGGTYRFRRYSRFLLPQPGQALAPLTGNSIYQELHDNPLNGGVVRIFAPLLPETLSNPFLHHLIARDAQLLGLADLPVKGGWAVGVHQLHIIARQNLPGHPAPEGIHIDAERFTVQHLIERHNVRGGVFSVYSQLKQPIFHWLQLQAWDTVFFAGSTWHGATPITLLDPTREGYRNITLIDFHPLEPPS